MSEQQVDRDVGSKAEPASGEPESAIMGVAFEQDGDMLDDGEGGAYESDEPGPEPEPDQPQRDDKGRFLPRGQATPEQTAEGGEQPPQPEATPTAAEPAPTGEGFEIGGHKWESREKADESIRTLRGHYKRFEQNDRDARARIADLERQVTEYAQAFQRLQSGQIPASDPRGQAQPAVTEPTATFDGLDNYEDLYWQVFSQEEHDAINEAVEEGKITAHQANAYVSSKLTSAALDLQFKRLNSRIDPLIQDREAERQFQQQKGEALKIFSTLKSAKAEDGKLLYPVLSDMDEEGNSVPGAAQHVIDLWVRGGQHIDNISVLGMVHMVTEAIRRANRQRKSELDMGIGVPEATVTETRPTVNSSTAATLAVGAPKPAPLPSAKPKDKIQAEVRSMFRDSKSGMFGVVDD